MNLYPCPVTTYQLWDLIFKCISILAIFGGAFKYLSDRNYAVSQYNSKFIHELGLSFDNNNHHQEANRMIEITSRNHPYGGDTELKSVLKKWGKKELLPQLNQRELDVLFIIDRYLDFFDRIYHYVFVTKALRLKDAECFRWYLAKIVETQCVYDYAVNNGYEDVVKLHKGLEDYKKKSEGKVKEGCT